MLKPSLTWTSCLLENISPGIPSYSYCDFTVLIFAVLLWSNFCFPSDHFSRILPLITWTMFQARNKLRLRVEYVEAQDSWFSLAACRVICDNPNFAHSEFQWSSWISAYKETYLTKLETTFSQTSSWGNVFLFSLFGTGHYMYLKKELSLTYFCAHTYIHQCRPRLVLLLFLLTQNIFKTFLFQTYS